MVESRWSEGVGRGGTAENGRITGVDQSADESDAGGCVHGDVEARRVSAESQWRGVSGWWMMAGERVRTVQLTTEEKTVQGDSAADETTTPRYPHRLPHRRQHLHHRDHHCHRDRRAD